MKPILLATDGSPTAAQATQTAIDYAKAFGAPLLIIAVWDVTYDPIGVAYGPVIPDIDHVGHEQAEEVVARAATKARRAGVEPEVLIRRGNPVAQICAVAKERDARMIVVGSRGWGPFKRALFGSVSTGVLHHATQPVFVVRSDVVASETVDETPKLSLVT